MRLTVRLSRIFRSSRISVSDNPRSSLPSTFLYLKVFLCLESSCTLRASHTLTSSTVQSCGEMLACLHSCNSDAVNVWLEKTRPDPNRFQTANTTIAETRQNGVSLMFIPGPCFNLVFFSCHACSQNKWERKKIFAITSSGEQRRQWSYRILHRCT